MNLEKIQQEINLENKQISITAQELRKILDGFIIGNLEKFTIEINLEKLGTLMNLEKITKQMNLEKNRNLEKFLKLKQIFIECA